MYCKNCGKLLGEGDKFCSNCGTKVETEFIPDFKKRQQEYPQETQQAKDTEPEERPRRNVHIEEFNWDLEGYPTDRKKTEDVNFNWESVLDDRQKLRRGEEPQEKEEESFFFENQPSADAASGISEETDVSAASENGDRHSTAASGEQTGRIDRFFTFNKKNEEFQQLLDREYEKIKNGEEPERDREADAKSDPAEEGAASSPFLFRRAESEPAAVFTEKPEDAESPAESAAAENDPAAEAHDASEHAAAEESLSADAHYVDVVLASAPDGIIVEKTTLQEEETVPPERKYPPSGAEREEAGEENAKNRTRLTFDDVFGDDDSDEAPPKKHKALKVIAIILCILIALELVIIGIQYFAPDSAAGKLINDTYGRILELFTGEEEEAAPAAVPADEPSQLQSLLDSQADKNKNIATIGEDTQLLFEDGKDYGFEDFGNSYTFVNESWYTGDDGEPVTYGEEIIGTLIAYYSAWVDKMNENSDEILAYIDETSPFYTEIAELAPEEGVKYGINRLSVGEMRSGSAGFYVLTAVTLTDSDSNEEKTETQAVYLEPEDKTIKIVTIEKI